MNEKEQLQLKQKLYGARAKRTGIPVRFFALTEEDIATYEVQKEKDLAEKRKHAREKAAKKKHGGRITYSIPHLGKKAPKIDDFDQFGEVNP